jgi:intracellular multiplication protein IcmE
MSGMNIGSPRLRIFSSAGAAGPRRLALMGGTAVVILGVVGVVLMRGHQERQPSHVASLPDVNGLPGGMHSNAYYNHLATTQAQQQAETAAAKGQSSVAPIPAGVPTQPVVAVPPASTQSSSPRTFARPAAPAHLNTTVAYTPPAAPAATQPTPEQRQEGQVYAAAVGSLLANWGNGPAPATQVYLDPNKMGAAASGEGSRAQAQAEGQSETASARDSRFSAASAAPPAAVLIPAGKGVYARTKLSASSDTGGPVVVTAESGPIAGDDMMGTFSRRGDRLVVELNSITLQNGAQESIDALVIAPDSMETAVASSVDPHVMSRFVLPVAAAFVAGLGQAIEQSNATVAVSPFGGYTAQNHLNFNQQLGVAAGTAGSQLQNFLLQDRPNGPTVKLAAGVNVGVIFLKPLTASATP